MLVLRAGCKVPFPEKLFEEYMLKDYTTCSGHFHLWFIETLS